MSSPLQPGLTLRAPPHPSTPLPVIRLNGISKSYRTEAGVVVALRSIDLEISRGEIVAVMGPSGSGKSTFMNLVGCLDHPSAGSYELDGDEVATVQGDRLAEFRNQRIGFVFQQFNLLARASAVENVALPLLYAGIRRRERIERARAMLERIGLADRMNHTPVQLSGGQQQRVAIARALINNPSVILADEPTGALDSATSKDVMAFFQSLNEQGQTVIFVTHDPDVAGYARRVIAFRDGGVVQDTNCA